MKRLLSALTVCALVSGCGSTIQTTSSGTAPGASTDGLGASTAIGSTSGPVGGSSSTAAPDAGSTSDPAAPTDPSAGTSITGPSAGSTGGPRVQGSAPTTAPGGPASTGRGWDQRHVYIGVTTANDIGTVGSSIGVKSINPGNLQHDAAAMIAYLNSQGGLFGRQLVARYFDVSTTDNGDTVGQEICEHFTHDEPVIGLINMTTNGDTPSFDACTAKAHLPVMAWVTDTGDSSFFAGYHGFYNNMPFPSWQRIAKTFVQRLAAQSYFSPWDTSLGRPGTAAVKTGLILPDVPVGHQIGKVLVAQLTSVGRAPSPKDVFYYTGSQDISSAELKFRSDGVTHVFGDEVLFLFMEEFETQHYRPRYALNSSNAPSLFLEGTVPAGQLAGSMGIGVTPTIDVFAPRDPGVAAVPGEALCNRIFRSAGVSYPQDQRYAYTNMYGMCDGMRMLVEAAKTTGGLTGDDIRDGIGQAAGRVPSSLSFGNGFTQTDRGLPGAARDLFFDGACSCFRYRGSTYRI